MRYAISTDGDSVSAHFGRCPSFTIVDIEKKTVVKKEVLDNPGHHPGYLPEFLHQRNVNSIICGGMGQRATGLFRERGIATIVGIGGKISDVTAKLAAGILQAGESLCQPGAGKNYGLEKTACDHEYDKSKPFTDDHRGE
jgi:predicted Fe-Mo cluster-binding NifX family protein